MFGRSSQRGPAETVLMGSEGESRQEAPCGSTGCLQKPGLAPTPFDPELTETSGRKHVAKSPGKIVLAGSWWSHVGRRGDPPVASAPPSILQTERAGQPPTAETIKGDADAPSRLGKLGKIDAQAGRSTPGKRARPKRSIKVWLLWGGRSQTSRTRGRINAQPQVQW